MRIDSFLKLIRKKTENWENFSRLFSFSKRNQDKIHFVVVLSMNRTNMKDEFNNLDKSGGLTKYFQDEFEMLEQKLDDDRFFCQREIESTRTHLKKLEEKFSQKIHELRQCLDQLEEKNENSHRQNKEDFERETTMINELHFSNHRREGSKLFVSRGSSASFLFQLGININDVKNILINVKK